MQVFRKAFQVTKFNKYILQKPAFFSMNQQKKDEYGRPYPNYEKYPAPVLAADAVVIRQNKQTNQPEILMCTRGKEGHFKDCFVFPGGHVDYNEAPEKACVRELKEEANIDGFDPELLTVKGDAQRDPRKHVVTVAYLVKVPEDQVPKGGDDASDAQFYPLKDIVSQKDKIGFDHYEIIQLAIQKLNIKL